MVGVRAPLVGLFLVGGACTMSNPAFEVADASGEAGDDDDDRGEDDGSEATTNATAESEAGSLEGSAGGESAAEAEGGESEAGSSEGTQMCPGNIEYDLEVAILDDGLPAMNIDCTVPLVLQGPVVEAGDGFVLFSPCNGCKCGSPVAPIEVQAPGLLPGIEFPNDTCVRIDIDWSIDEACRPVGFVASSDRVQPIRPVSIGGQDVAMLPQALGGGSIGLSTVEPCDCPDCCSKSGTAALDFGSGGGPIAEGEEEQIQGLAGSERTWLVTVHEAHVHEDCSRGIAWTAIVDHT
jgi:hypothetical protein